MTIRLALAAAAIVLSLAAPSLFAAEPGKTEGVDQELFKPDEKKPSEPAPATKAPPPAEPGEKKLEKQLGRAGVSEDDSPLVSIARQMRGVEDALGRTDSGPATQEAQARIVANLNELLKQAAKGAGQCRPSQGKPPSTAPRQPIAQPNAPPKPGTGQPKATPNAAQPKKPDATAAKPKRPDMQEMLSLIKRLWGELPERERNQMLQLPPEEFLPKYETMIEDYYKRLAEERGKD